MLEETGNLVSGCWACILEFSESGQARGLERIQKARKAWAPGRISILKNSGPRSGSGSGAYTRYSKSLGPGEICILKNLEPGQVPGLGRIQKARRVQAQDEICILKFSELEQAPGRRRILVYSKNRAFAD